VRHAATRSALNLMASLSHSDRRRPTWEHKNHTSSIPRIILLWYNRWKTSWKANGSQTHAVNCAYSRVAISLSLHSELRAIRLKTALTDTHVFARHVASCIFHLRRLFHWHNTTFVGDKWRAGNSAIFFHSSWGLLRHKEAGQGIIK
jgi:hypothetical protein